MHIDPQSATSALGLVNSAVTAVKSAFEVAKKSSDHELKAQVGLILDSVLDLKVKVLELDEENRQLKHQLHEKANIKRDPETGNFYKEGEQNLPLCPGCYQGASRAIVYLQPSVGGSAYCDVCRRRYGA